jgi:hypothetical protein
MEIMTVWITAMKTIDISVMTESVILKQNLHVKRINNGGDLSVFQRNGYAMEIQIVWTVLMKIQQFIAVQHHNHALMINLHVAMEDVLIMDGFVTMTMIVVTVPMKANSVILSTRHAHLKNSHARTSSV